MTSRKYPWGDTWDLKFSNNVEHIGGPRFPFDKGRNVWLHRGLTKRAPILRIQDKLIPVEPRTEDRSVYGVWDRGVNSAEGCMDWYDSDRCRWWAAHRTEPEPPDINGDAVKSKTATGERPRLDKSDNRRLLDDERVRQSGDPSPMQRY